MKPASNVGLKNSDSRKTEVEHTPAANVLQYDSLCPKRNQILASVQEEYSVSASSQLCRMNDRH